MFMGAQPFALSLEYTHLITCPSKPVTLKELAAILELSQSTVSRIVNGAGAAHRIAVRTVRSTR